MIKDQTKLAWTVFVVDVEKDGNIRPLFGINLQYVPKTLKLNFESNYIKQKGDGLTSPSLQFKDNKILSINFTAFLHDSDDITANVIYQFLLNSMAPNSIITQPSINTGSPPILLLIGPVIPVPFFTRGQIGTKFISTTRTITPVVLTKINAKLSEFNVISPSKATPSKDARLDALESFQRGGTPKHIEVDLSFFVVVLPEQKEDMNINSNPFGLSEHFQSFGSTGHGKFRHHQGPSPAHIPGPRFTKPTFSEEIPSS